MKLVKYEQARLALAECCRVDEAKDILDKAEALRVYGKQAKDNELETWAAEIKLRANRRIGEISLMLEKAKPGVKGGELGPARGLNSKSEALKEAGLTKQQAHRCEQIAGIPEEQFEEFIAKKKAANKPVYSTEVIREVVKEKKKAIKPVDGDEPCCSVEDLAKLAAGSKFGCIYVDPPWNYGNQGTRAATDNHYSTMAIEDIAALPVKELAAEESHLHLWTTKGFLPEALSLISTWGFTYKSWFCWVKPQLGIGNYWRGCSEIMLLGVKGGLTFPPNGFIDWLQADRTKHSAKPEKIRELIEKVSPGPRLEMFARKTSPGWTVWGNEVKRRDLFAPEATEAP